MASALRKNAWVDKYLEALLGDGLSSEYVNRVDDVEGEDDGTLAANYWINLIFDYDQENIVASWRKAKVRAHALCSTGVRLDTCRFRAMAAQLYLYAPRCRAKLSLKCLFHLCAACRGPPASRAVELCDRVLHSRGFWRRVLSCPLRLEYVYGDTI